MSKILIESPRNCISPASASTMTSLATPNFNRKHPARFLIPCFPPDYSAKAATNPSLKEENLSIEYDPRGTKTEPKLTQKPEQGPSFFELDENAYLLPSQKISPVSSLSEIADSKETELSNIGSQKKVKYVLDTSREWDSTTSPYFGVPSTITEPLTSKGSDVLKLTMGQIKDLRSAFYNGSSSFREKKQNHLNISSLTQESYRPLNRSGTRKDQVFIEAKPYCVKDLNIFGGPLLNVKGSKVMNSPEKPSVLISTKTGSFKGTPRKVIREVKGYQEGGRKISSASKEEKSFVKDKSLGKIINSDIKQNISKDSSPVHHIKLKKFLYV